MSVLIVDDHPVIHEILGAVVRRVFGETSIQIAVSLEDAMQKAAGAADLDLVLLDLGLPDSAGLETLARFRRVHPNVRVVVFSATVEPSCVVSALEAGASGYVPKTSTPSVIKAALQVVAAGGTYVPPQAIKERGVAQAARRDIELTERQRDVLRLITRGLANKEIAKQLNLHVDTVKHHARAAYAVLGVSSRTQAMNAVTRRGMRLD